MSGKTCATEAALLSSGMPKDAVWVESMVSPLRNMTLNGFCDMILLRHGALINIKCPVHPESNIAVSRCSRSGGVRQSSGTRWPISTHTSAAIIPSMVTSVKPLRQTTWGAAKQTENDMQGRHI
jgi:hypothetical protein